MVYDPRFHYSEVFGQTISLKDLMVRWQCNQAFLDTLIGSVNSKTLDRNNQRILSAYRPNHLISMPDDSNAILFIPQPTEHITVFDMDEFEYIQSLPEETFFYLVEVLDFESHHPEILKKLDEPIESFETTNLSSSTSKVNHPKEILNRSEVPPPQPKKTRENELHILIWKIDQLLTKEQGRRPTAQNIWKELRHHSANYDIDEIIQEVTKDCILWCSSYGHEQKMKRSTFSKTLSNLRSTPPF